MILTITLNPALDKLMSIEALEIGEANRTETIAMYAAGKGVDVAKVLSDLGEDVCATGFLGGMTAGVFHDCFREKNIRDEFIAIEGTTRTNLQLFGKDGKRTELLEKGPKVLRHEWDALLERVEALLPQCSAVTVCGSAPEGITGEMYRSLLRMIKQSGVVTIADASGELLKEALIEKPHLIKPNQSEMAELMGKPGASHEEITAFAKELVAGGIDYVLVSLGKDGAMLVCKEGVWNGKAPDVEVKSTLGCGDTMVASLAISIPAKESPADMLKNAIALSSANVMTFETAHIRREDYAMLKNISTVIKRA